MKRFIALPILVLLAAGVLRAQSVKSDFDRNFNLDSIKTFNFYKIAMGQSDLTVGSPVIDQSVQQEFTKALASAGYSRGDNPDFLIAYYGVIDPKSSLYLTSLGYIAPSSWNYGGYIMSAERMNVSKGSLVVDFISSGSGKAFWRGIASKTLVDRGASPKDIEKAADKLIRQFRKDLEKQQKESRGRPD